MRIFVLAEFVVLKLRTWFICVTFQTFSGLKKHVLTAQVQLFILIHYTLKATLKCAVSGYYRCCQKRLLAHTYKFDTTRYFLLCFAGEPNNSFHWRQQRIRFGRLDSTKASARPPRSAASDKAWIGRSFTSGTRRMRRPFQKAILLCSR